jgi:hypothetical protein
MSRLLDALASALECPRDVPGQVVRHLAGVHGVDRADVGHFLTSELPGLEDFEVELILSPIFTPTLQDQAPFAEFLDATSVPATEWPELIERLAARPTCAQLVTDDGVTHSIPLRDVAIERYVYRLRLDGTIPEALLDFISHLPPADRPLLKAVARRAVWEHHGRRQILRRYLAAAGARENHRRDDVIELLKLIENYQPDDIADFLARIPHWEQVLRHEINLASGPKAFFNERVEELHGGGRDQRRQDGGNIASKEGEWALLERLRQVLVE